MCVCVCVYNYRIPDIWSDIAKLSVYQLFFWRLVYLITSFIVHIWLWSPKIQSFTSIDKLKAILLTLYAHLSITLVVITSAVYGQTGNGARPSGPPFTNMV